MIEELQRLRTSRVWRASEPVTLAPVTVLLGTNSSGKSSIIQSLLLLKQTAASPDRTIHFNLGGDEVHDFFNFGGFENVLTEVPHLRVSSRSRSGSSVRATKESAAATFDVVMAKHSVGRSSSKS